MPMMAAFAISTVTAWLKQCPGAAEHLTPVDVSRLAVLVTSALDEQRDARDREWGALLLRLSGADQSGEAAFPCPTEAGIKAWLAAHAGKVREEWALRLDARRRQFEAERETCIRHDDRHVYDNLISELQRHAAALRAGSGG